MRLFFSFLPNAVPDYQRTLNFGKRNVGYLAGWGAFAGLAVLYLVEPQFVFRNIYGSERYNKK